MMGGIKWPSVYTFSFHQGEIMVLLQRGPALVIFSCYYLCIFILWNYYYFCKFYITQAVTITIHKLLLLWTLHLYSYFTYITALISPIFWFQTFRNQFCGAFKLDNHMALWRDPESKTAHFQNFSKNIGK